MENNMKGNFDPKALSQKAIELARNLEVELSFKESDIVILSKILDETHRRYFEEGLNDDTAWGLAVVYGAYLGETMLRNGMAAKGFRWSDDGKAMLVNDDEVALAPIRKTYKHIAFGTEEHIGPLYKLGMAIARDEFDFDTMTGKL